MNRETDKEPPEPVAEPDPTWPPAASAPAWSLSDGLADQPAPSSEERYRLDRLLGQGGMGRVYVAEDRVLRRQVALKALREPLADDPMAQRRLTREALITAQLDHPGIVAVHDAGQLPGGAPFYTMRMVRGASMAEALSRAAGLPDRLALLRPLLAATEAIAYAHQAGIVHRDIKPDNILIGGLGETQVVDWGLARPIDGEADSAWVASLDSVDPVQTQHGTIVGTPAYISPEQARGEEVDARSDVYSLGATLLELLVGAPPYPKGDPQAALRQARSGTPRLDALNQEDIPAELAAICRRALQPRPAQRYPDGSALAAELARWFEGRRVEAYDYSAWELLRRLWRLWRAPVIATVVVVIATVGILLSSDRQIRAERDRALSAEAEAVAARQRSDELLADALLRQAVEAVRQDNRAIAELFAIRAMALGATERARAVLAAFSVTSRPRQDSTAQAPACPRYRFSGDGARLLCIDIAELTMLDARSLAVLWRRPFTVADPDTISFAAADQPVVLLQNNRVYQLDPDTGADLQTHRALFHALYTRIGPTGVYYGSLEQMTHLSGAEPAPAALGCTWRVHTVAVREDSQIVRLCGDGRLLVGPLGAPPTLAVRTPFVDDLAPTMVISLDEQGLLVVGAHRGQVGVLDAETGALLHLVESPVGLVHELVPSPDHRWVAVRGARATPRVLDPQTGRWIATLPERGARALGWDTDTGQLLVQSNTLSRWSLRDPGTPYRLETDAGLAALAWAPSGGAITVSRGDGLVEEISLQDGRSTTLPPAFESVAKAVAYSPDGRWLAATGMRGPRLWVRDRHSGAALPLEQRNSGRRLAFLRDGRLLLSSFSEALWATPPDQEAQRVRYASTSVIVDMNGPADGSRVVTLGMDNLIAEFVSGGSGPRPLATAPGASAVDICADGSRYVVALYDRVEIHTRDGALLRAMDAPGADLRDIAISPDCALVAAGGVDGLARLWSMDSGAQIALLRGHTNRVSALSFSPDGTRLATVSWDRSTRIWDLRVFDQPADDLIAEVLGDWGASLDEIGRDE